MKLPFMKFYVRDWQSDFELRMCSLTARGFWFECLCTMHSAKRRGYLETPQGLPLTEEQLTRLMGAFKGDVKKCLKELGDHGVYSTDENGIIYSRRMVKDAVKSEKCSKAGKNGGGSPLLNSKDKEDTRNHISLKVTFKGVDILTNDAFDLFWNEYPRKTDKKKASAKFFMIVKNKEFDDLDTLMDAIKKAKRTIWKDSEQKHIPHPTTWLDGARWNDVLVGSADKRESPKQNFAENARKNEDLFKGGK